MLLVAKKHVSSIVALEDKEWQEISIIMKKVPELIENVLMTKHVNIGINIDEYSGASISSHLHIHFVPRYKGDTNFMTAVFDTRVYPNKFEDIYNVIKDNIDKYIK
jgi:diadenosine tetraphosphate (Ap4A) HIT family hydrolase